MLLRLILALVLALTGAAMPVSAHDGAQSGTMAMAGHVMPGMDHGDRKAPMPMQHLCVGCVPIGDWNAARVTPPLLLPAPAPIAIIAALPLLPGEAPTPPPPRIA